jgi:hypothetical protein
MFGTIRKHQQWLWAVIITLTVISFVIYFSPYSKMNSGNRAPMRFGSINGEEIGEQNFFNARREIDLRYFFMSRGSWPGDDSKRMGFDADVETYKWLLLIQKQDALAIHPSPEAVSQFATELLRQISGGNQVSSAAFEQQVLTPHGLQLADFERFVRHYLGIQELSSTVGVGGKLVTPQEAKGLYERERQEVATEVVFFSASNHLAQVPVSPERLSQFYSNQLANYRIPERRQVSYVKFSVSNFVAEAEAEWAKTNINEIVENEFTRLGTNYLSLAKTADEAKVKIRERYVHGLALVKARRKAADFANPLFTNDPPRLVHLEKLAKENGLSVNLTPPFDRDNLPKDVDAGVDFLKQAFTRTPDEPLAPPIVGKDGVYIIALNKQIPSEIPPLDKIRDEVTKDFKNSQAVSLARIAGIEFWQTLTNGLAKGKTFAAICSEAKLKPVELPSFSLSTKELPDIEDHIRINQLKEMAFRTPPGKVSEFQDTQAGGIILNVKSKLPLDEARMRTELPNFVNYVRQRRQEEAFEAWFRKEADKGLRDTPVNRQQQPPPVMAPGAAGKS